MTNEEIARFFNTTAKGYPHHITQRGNNKEKTFFSDEDKRYYLDTLSAIQGQIQIKDTCILYNVTSDITRDKEFVL